MTHWKSRDTVALVKKCIAEDPAKYSKYPCRDGRKLYWPDGSRAELELSEDQTVRIRSCGFPTAHPEINRGDRDIVEKWKDESKTQNLRNILLFELRPPNVPHISFPKSYLSGGRCDALLTELDDASLWEVKSPRWYSSPLRSLEGFSQWFGRTEKGRAAATETRV